jgi:hypothetical protein
MGAGRISMKRAPSPAQRAIQVTFVLKGHLKNARIAYLRVGTLLAKMRDEKLYREIGHDTMESYAAERLGLQRSSLYRYLHVYDWVRDSHPQWLAKKPKGFIPELTDVAALIWIERRLRDKNLGAETRARLEALRDKALVGKLTDREFRDLVTHANGTRRSLRSFLRSMQAIRRQAETIPKLPPDVLARIDELIRKIEAAIAAVERVAKLTDIHRIPFVPRVVRRGNVSAPRLR